MKKTWKRLTALLLAACAAASVPAVSASALWYWGNASNDQFADMQQLDDKGMFQWVGYGGIPGTPCDYQVYTKHIERVVEPEEINPHVDQPVTEPVTIKADQVYVVKPRENVLRIVLRKEIDHDAAEQKMYEILEKYYPGITEYSRNTTPDTPRMYYVHLVQIGVTDFASYYDLVDNSKAFPTEEAKTAGVPEISDGIIRDLAKAGLSSEFYTWGQTANYQQVTLPSRIASPTAYIPSYQNRKSGDPTDWTAIETWVKEHHPECEFVCVTLEDTELAKKIGYYNEKKQQPYFGNDEFMYAVIPPEGTTFPEHFAIAAELYEQFGIEAEWLCPESASAPITGQNALAAAGDVNLDSAIDVSDAVLLARFCAEDSEAVITAQGKQNADLDYDSNITGDDVIAILRKIAKLD